MAPIQTLTDREYQRMRDASFAILREVGVDTGANDAVLCEPRNRRDAGGRDNLG